MHLELRDITDFPYTMNPLHFVRTYRPKGFGLPIRATFKALSGNSMVVLPEGSNVTQDDKGFIIVLPMDEAE